MADPHGTMTHPSLWLDKSFKDVLTYLTDTVINRFVQTYAAYSRMIIMSGSIQIRTIALILKITYLYIMKIYRKLISLKTISALSTDEAIEHIGLLTDAASRCQKKKGLHQALSLSNEIRKGNLTIAQQAILNYHTSNIWGNLHKLQLTSETDNWEQMEIEKQLFYLRRSVIAVKQDDFRELTSVQVCPIYTNLAAALYQIGRFVEAIEYWNKALDIKPDFSMAKGNRGLGLIHYAHALYDDDHALLFLRQARDDLKSALESGVERQAEPVFQNYFHDLEHALSSEAMPHINSHVQPNIPGKTEEEINYRTWCLEYRLFLNPLNDLGTFPSAASDLLCTPSIIMEKGETPYFHGFYNQIKQEYVSARWLYYDGITSQAQHFSDSHVLLLNTLDYPVYGLAAEKIKISFRMLYSLFDKIAFFLNRYMPLSIKEKKVHFRTFWYENHTRTNTLRKTLELSENWPLRGLFWLSKDLYEDRDGFKEALEPDARELLAIRNHLEHKYLKYHEPPEKLPYSNDNSESFGFSIHRKDFEIKVLRILKMVRAALIYLALAIHSEEKRRLEQRKASQPIQVVELPFINDDRKM